MDSHLADSLTISLADGNLTGAYPIASYTYLVIYRTEMTNCDSARELVRWVPYLLLQIGHIVHLILVFHAVADKPSAS